MPPPQGRREGMTVQGTTCGDLHRRRAHVTLWGPSSPSRGVDVVGGHGVKTFGDYLWKAFLEFASVGLHFVSIFYCGLSVVLLILTLEV